MEIICEESTLHPAVESTPLAEPSAVQRLPQLPSFSARRSTLGELTARIRGRKISHDKSARGSAPGEGGANEPRKRSEDAANSVSHRPDPINIPPMTRQSSLEKHKRVRNLSVYLSPTEVARATAWKEALDDCATGAAAFEELAWSAALPALADVIASVWLPPTIVVCAHDAKTFVLNVSGALLEGVCAACEGDAAPDDTADGALGGLAGRVRAHFLGAYTSWAAMVGCAATLALQRGSFGHAIAYLVASVLSGALACAVGEAAAARALVMCTSWRARARADATADAAADAARVRTCALGAVLACLAGSFALVIRHVAFHDFTFVEEGTYLRHVGDAPLLSIFETEAAQMALSALSAAAGSAVGAAIGQRVDGRAAVGDAPRGTLVCNTLAALAALALPAATLRRGRYGRSVALRALAGPFCGAASAFSAHCAETVAMRRAAGGWRACRHVGCALIAALAVTRVAYEIELLLTQPTSRLDTNGDGAVGLAELLAHYGLGSGLGLARASPPPPKRPAWAAGTSARVR